MRVLLDTNVILDAMLQRPPWHGDADAILKAASQGLVTCAATANSLTNVFYIGRRTVGTAHTRTGIRLYLQAFEILPIDKQTLLDADTLAGNDFEDNVEIAAAVIAQVDAIVTRNASDFSHSPIPVWSPAELLRRLQRSGQHP